MSSYKMLQAEKVDVISAHDGIILDVRTDMEHAEKRLGMAHVHVPLDQLKPSDVMMRHGLDKDSGVYILCRSGKRAATAAEKFAAEGYRNVHVIEGGIIACESCGKKVDGDVVTQTSAQTTASARGSKVIPLERQVRIAAGLISGAGALLALLVHPFFAVIPLAVGGGLVFAGVTDRCGLALVLTKAPWNKQVEKAACAAPACSASTKTGQSCQ